MRRLTCVIMTIVLIMSSIIMSTITGFAGENNSEQLKKAITEVKKAVNIPDSMDKFDYSYGEESDGQYSIYLNWSNSKENSYASAEIDETGLIKSFYCYLPEFESTGLAKISKDDAEKIAKKALTQLLPKKIIGTVEKQNDEKVYGSDYVFNYKLYINGIPCDFVSISIAINKYAGKVSNYNCHGEFSDLTENNYPTTQETIGIKKAQEIYFQQLCPQIKFISYYDYEKQQLSIFPAYVSCNTNKVIDAITGDIIELSNDISIFRASMDKNEIKESSTADEAGGVTFSKVELEELSKSKNLIDTIQSDKIARNLINSIGKQKLENSALRIEEGPDRNYIWNLNYENAFVRINAEDRSIVGFNIYKEQNEKDTRDIGVEKAKTIADDFISRICPDKKEYLELTNVENAKYGNNYNISYERKTDYVNYRDNGINIVIDKGTGEILSYYDIWYKNAKFSKEKDFITVEKAFNEMDKLGKFGLVYKKNTENKPILVYTFRNSDSYMIDGYTGVAIDYRGKPIDETKKYTDIQGHWAEKTIVELQENGYYLQGDKFNPNMSTTQLEFFKYLYSQEQKYYTDEDKFYKMLLDNKIITEQEMNPKAYITRQEAAKFISRYMGVECIAKESKIFRNMYNDKIEPGYIGYAATVYALGIMKGDSKGKFNGSNNLSHAETACVIYNILNRE